MFNIVLNNITAMIIPFAAFLKLEECVHSVITSFGYLFVCYAERTTGVVKLCECALTHTHSIVCLLRSMQASTLGV